MEKVLTFCLLIHYNTIEGHIFEIYTMVSEIHDNIDLVLGIKIFFELQEETSMGELIFKFLNRAVPIFSVKGEDEPIIVKKMHKAHTYRHLAKDM